MFYEKQLTIEWRLKHTNRRQLNTNTVEKLTINVMQTLCKNTKI